MVAEPPTLPANLAIFPPMHGCIAPARAALSFLVPLALLASLVGCKSEPPEVKPDYTRQLGPGELAEVERSRAFECVDARVHQRFDALVGRTGAPGRGRRSTWVRHPFTGRPVRAAVADAP